MGRDPIPIYHERLLRLGDARGAVERPSPVRSADAVDAATEFAKAGDEPGPEVLMTEVWADGGSAWRN